MMTERHFQRNIFSIMVKTLAVIGMIFDPLSTNPIKFRVDADPTLRVIIYLLDFRYSFEFLNDDLGLIRVQSLTSKYYFKKS